MPGEIGRLPNASDNSRKSRKMELRLHGEPPRSIVDLAHSIQLIQQTISGIFKVTPRLNRVSAGLPKFAAQPINHCY